MLIYCFKCRKKQSTDRRLAKINKGKLIISSKFAVCDSKKSRFIKEQEVSGYYVA